MKHYQLPFTVQDVLRVTRYRSIGSVSAKGELELICPAGVSRSNGKPATFGVNLRTGQYNCFRECAGCPSKGGVLSLFCLLEGIPGGTREERSQAAGEIRKRLEGSATSGCSMQMILPQQPLTEVPSARLADIDQRDHAYRKLLEVLPLKEEDHADLKRRGLKEEYIQMGLFRSLPSGEQEWDSVIQTLLSEKVSLYGVPGFYQKEGRIRCAARYPGYFIPMFDREGKIYSMQVRRTSHVDDGPRYIWFSSSGHPHGVGAVNAASWGNPELAKRSAGGTQNAIYATEGGLKAFVAGCLARKHNRFLAIAGVNAFAAWADVCDELHSQGVTRIIDAFDSDRVSNEHVNRAIQNLYQIAENRGIQMIRFDWGTEQKGVDDYLWSIVRKEEA